MTIPTQAPELTVTTSATQTDAQLIIQLAQLSTSMRVDHGVALLHKHHKQGNAGLSYEAFQAAYPDGDADGTAILNVLAWNETVGTLVKQGLLDRGLVLDWLWVAGAWDRCRAIALGQREEMGVPGIWENFEALAASQT
ncbi:MAG: hypothetical protein QOJ79_2765 [Actinomycetota bacterium]|jgi:hypothetical protein|nr:hypothetical protein [Actinomycetota bacterium]